MKSMDVLHPDEETIAAALRREGYRTGVFGKLHLLPENYTLHDMGWPHEQTDVTPYLEPTGLASDGTRAAAADPVRSNYGFDVRFPVADCVWGHYLDWLSDVAPEHVKHHVSENWGKPRDGVKYGDSPPAKRMYREFTGDFFDSNMPAELHPSRFIVERAIDFVRENREVPFFAHVSFVDPHHPFNAPAGYKEMYPAAEMPAPPELDRRRCYAPGMPEGVQKAIEKKIAWPDGMFQWALANYYGMVSHIDWCVGLLLDELEAQGLAEKTIVIFTADHGEYVGDHRLMYKGSVPFEGLWRIPLMASWGGNLEAGLRTEAMVQEIDVYPTVMSLLGLPVHAGVQGRDISPVLRGESAEGRDLVFCELDDLPDTQYAGMFAVRSGEWKLAYYPGARTGLLYDMAGDPGELTNLFHDEGHRGERHEMMMHLLDFLYTSKDPLPIRLSQA